MPADSKGYFGDYRLLGYDKAAYQNSDLTLDFSTAYERQVETYLVRAMLFSKTGVASKSTGYLDTSNVLAQYGILGLSATQKATSPGYTVLRRKCLEGSLLILSNTMHN